MRNTLLVFLLSTLLSFIQAQEIRTIKWLPTTNITALSSLVASTLNFENAEHLESDNFLPRLFLQTKLNSTTESISGTLKNQKFIPLTAEETQVLSAKLNKDISTSITVSAEIVYISKIPYSKISFVPIRKNPTTGVLEKITSYSLSITEINTPQTTKYRTTRSTTNSVLSTGVWHKIAIKQSGVYKMDYAFLKNLGLDVKSINPQNIRIYGNGGTMLPELNSAPRPIDLTENAILVVGADDNSFDEDDYILFYGKGTTTWKQSSSDCIQFEHSLHHYSNSAYYFINTDIGAGKRISEVASSANVTTTVTTFNDYAFHEIDKVNFFNSGKQWFGELLENNNTLTIPFQIPTIDNTSDVIIKSSLASRNTNTATNYTASCQSGNSLFSVPATSPINYLDDYAKIGNTCFSFKPTSSNLNVVINKENTASQAWLDYIEINARRKLTLSSNQMHFRDLQSVKNDAISKFTINSSKPLLIWDITDIADVKAFKLSKTGNTYSFTTPTNTLKEFIAFNTNYLIPIGIGSVKNQNLHGLTPKDYIVITHPNFLRQAKQLANHHTTHDALSSMVVTTEQVYNEFSSGTPDASAIRDFIKLLYDKSTDITQSPKHVLLFGDGSFDNKNRLNKGQTFIPTFQAENSTFETRSFVSDDFYGLLDDGEGLWLSDALDIGIGRIPTKTVNQAQAVVDKIVNYSNNPTIEQNSTFGSWRNTICFIADDGDRNTHISQVEQQTMFIDTTYPAYTTQKIYLDAFPQETLPTGDKYPEVNNALIEQINKGALIINYTGHGSENQLAHEAVLTSFDIEALENKSKLFLFVTASCQISKYDNPAVTSAGELSLLNPNGGAIALLSTTRAVYASPNFQLNKNFYFAAFERPNGEVPRLGDLYKNLKNKPGGNSVNSRSFTLLGDPALKLAYPKYTVVTDTINNSAITETSADTLKALSIVKITGHIEDEAGNTLNSFNGTVYPTVYDKKSVAQSRSNKGSPESPVFSFSTQKNRLFNGKATVTNGKFSFSFVVPKDIEYTYGNGKISYYATDNKSDANGSYNEFIVGGYDKKGVTDNQGPTIELFLNDDNFVFGGLTNEQPLLYSEINDESGINITGNSFGHDAKAVLDANSANPIILNEYYEANKDSYQSGTIKYPFRKLREGKHTLNLEVWDVNNNRAESYTEFVVASSAKAALSHVLNYPNPFTTKTQFFFEHNQANSTFEVQLQIFTVSGKLVKSISKFVTMSGNRSEPIDWNGRDDYGNKIGRGVYIYRIKIISDTAGSAEKYEKLVILN